MLGFEKLYAEERRYGRESKPNGLFEKFLQAILRAYHDAKECKCACGGFHQIKKIMTAEKEVETVVEKYLNTPYEERIFWKKIWKKSYPATNIIKMTEHEVAKFMGRKRFCKNKRKCKAVSWKGVHT